ncbi:1278_t:CDS:2 [Gigaspora margarita]|uniref:1278_t:CDS:1 n=1 Tax=Gigaspora margarita TaxID=4874 RepID=A0ABM8W738_GIGMA|nr:1278_t:CDS:2 [Gigaspora margarita]
MDRPYLYYGPGKEETASCIGGINDNKIFIIGGSNSSNSSSLENFINKFNIKASSNGIMLHLMKEPLILPFMLFNAQKSIRQLKIMPNNLWIFDTITANNALQGRCCYCVISLPDGNLLYIGGVDNANHWHFANEFKEPTSDSCRPSTNKVLPSL